MRARVRKLGPKRRSNCCQRARPRAQRVALPRPHRARPAVAPPVARPAPREPRAPRATRDPRTPRGRGGRRAARRPAQGSIRATRKAAWRCRARSACTRRRTAAASAAAAGTTAPRAPCCRCTSRSRWARCARRARARCRSFLGAGGTRRRPPPASGPWARPWARLWARRWPSRHSRSRDPSSPRAGCPAFGRGPSRGSGSGRGSAVTAPR